MDGNIFTQELLAWYDTNRRDLPWRTAVRPYAVWVSEIMAQQTQIDRVVGYYDRWMSRFPNIDSLVEAGEEEVLKLWEGLGYYSRARNMLKAARVIVDEHAGIFPSDVASLRALPGIGDYTAGAISSIAFSRSEPAVDANVLRVFARLLDLDSSVRESGTRAVIVSQVRMLIPENRPGDFNQALMEFGALVCSKKPQCVDCPVKNECAAFGAGTVDVRPVLPKSKKAIRIDMATGVLLHKGRVLIQKRRPDDVWPGLWEFPGGVIEKGETPEQAVAREYMEEVGLVIEPIEPIATVAYNYTRYRVTMHGYLCRFNAGYAEPEFYEAVEGGFVLPDELDSYAFPAGHRRLTEAMKSDRRFKSLFLAK